MKRILRYLLALLIFAAWLFITGIGNIVIVKLAKEYFINPIEWCMKFSLGMLVLFFTVIIWIILWVLPDR